MLKVRPDRLGTLYFFHPLKRLLRGCAPAGIPILMYHSISSTVERHRNTYFDTCTHPQVFREHIQLLAREGYESIGLAEAIIRLQKSPERTEKSVVLTFDDGFEDFYTEAFPVLNTYGYTATVFLPTAYIGDSPGVFNGIRCLTWNQARELQIAGIEFGSHTVTHPRLQALPPMDVEWELRLSKEEIEQRLCVSVASFSYPYSFPEADRSFVRHFCGYLENAGYKCGVSTVVGRAGRADHPFLLNRLPVNSGDDLRLFQAKLEGDYDWLHAVQYASKVINPATIVGQKS